MGDSLAAEWYIVTLRISPFSYMKGEEGFCLTSFRTALLFIAQMSSWLHHPDYIIIIHVVIVQQQQPKCVCAWSWFCVCVCEMWSIQLMCWLRRQTQPYTRTSQFQCMTIVFRLYNNTVLRAGLYIQNSKHVHVVVDNALHIIFVSFKKIMIPIVMAQAVRKLVCHKHKA